MLKKINFIFLICWIIMCVIIFLLSHQTSESSYQLTSGVIDSFNQQVNRFVEWDAWTGLRKLIFDNSRKFGHVLLYFVLTVFAIPAFYKNKFKSSSIVSFVINLLYAVTDEFHQSFISGRGASIGDILIDVIGIVMGIFLCYILHRINWKKQ